MELELFRTYYPDGTNGETRHVGIPICHTIELPWLQNLVLDALEKGEKVYLNISGVAARATVL